LNLATLATSKTSLEMKKAEAEIDK